MNISSNLSTLPGPERPTLTEALASARDTKTLLIGSGVISQLGETFGDQFSGAKALIVADDASFSVAGPQVVESLRAVHLGGDDRYIYPDRPLPAEHTFVEKLEQVLRQGDLIPVAVGSGTINDLVKLAAHRTGRRYLCVATAASMDGYTAFGASITHHGAKQTFDCPAPHAVIADIDIIRSAPAAMTAAGYADLQAKITAGADWMLADALGVESIDPLPWTLVQGGLRSALANPAGARSGDREAVTQLVEGLMLGGFAMQWSESSRPASGAEHQFSHLWDMEHHVYHGHPPSHGFKVGIATLAVAAFYEQLLTLPLDQLDIAACVARWPSPAATESTIHYLFDAHDFLPTALQETKAKYCSPEELTAQLTRLKSGWIPLRTQLQHQLIPFTEMRKRLEAVGAPTTPEAIGISRHRLRESFLRAQHIRKRFTVLDLAVRTGTLEICLDRLFGPNGPWDTTATP